MDYHDHWAYSIIRASIVEKKQGRKVRVNISQVVRDHFPNVSETDIKRMQSRAWNDIHRNYRPTSDDRIIIIAKKAA